MGVLKIGKLDSDVLQKIVINKIEKSRPEIKVSAGIGEDCAVIDFGDYDCVISTDPITSDVKNIGKLAIHISCNDIASNGVQPLGITLAVMLPYGTTEEEVSKMMSQAQKAAKLCGVEIVGGHTEVTKAVNQPVIVSTAFGRSLAGKSQSAKEMKPGDWILLTKQAGLEGTGIVATDLAESLKDVLTAEEFAEAAGFLDQVSVVKEGVIAGEVGTSGMHDVTEGGVYGAVWEMCNISGTGALINENDIPVSTVTLKICEHFGADYRRLISSGCMLIVASENNAKEIMSKLTEEKIPVSKIGEVKPKEAGIRAVDDEKEYEILPPKADELYKMID